MQKWIVAIVGALALSTALTIAPAAHAATADGHVLVGSNRNPWEQFKTDVPAAQATRIYYDATGVFPKTWPAKAGPCTLVSLRPAYGALMAGQYDAELKTLFASAPPCSLVTIDHENIDGKGAANPLNYPPSIHNPAHFVAMQLHMESLVQGTNVRFGIVFIGPASLGASWMAPHLDWYGFDIYDNPLYWNPGKARTINKIALETRLATDLASLKKISGEKYPLLRIAETNSPWNRHRKTWFTTIVAWLAAHDGQRQSWVLSYWNPARDHASGGLSGPCCGSRAVVARLAWLAATYGG